MNYIEAIILAIVEGITEFLPISSTGHMIITAALMGNNQDAFTKVFIVAIQLGAILSVVVMYFKSFFKSFDFYFKLFVAFLPTVVLALLLKEQIDKLLESVLAVGISLFVGGVILLYIDKWFAKNEDQPENEISYKKAFLIGLFQPISMIPGVSRSASTIIGGLSQKLDRKTAAEFSFFLAVPTMFAATAKSLWDQKELLIETAADNLPILLIGNIVAFIVAILAIKFFIGVLTKYGFRFFGYYRIILGLIIIVLVISGTNLKLID